MSYACVSPDFLAPSVFQSDVGRWSTICLRNKSVAG